ncbi:D-aminoacylase [uncultured Clostridium sp.]|uniref:N-acyl-D-amino-acid deacylase family protein n=1 Tax=uncultured Clostridium sp. TaxID=59620 RepID=UPI0028EF00B9|nr:D-aminoacylase [uncultured Clostridium sp.]
MYDFVLKDGLIVDGARKLPYKASVCIKDDRIVEITDDSSVTGNKIINCEGKVISPGFIDLHTHSDACPLNSGKSESMLHQGVTLEIGGNCGISLIPSNESNRAEIREFFSRTIEISLEDEFLEMDNMKDYLGIANEHPLPINAGILIGHGTLRASVVGFDDREPTYEELEKMKSILHQELQNGAFGMSLGLIYPPSSYGKLHEFVELSKVIKENNGILTVHLRNESNLVFEAVDEMIKVAELSGVHLHISHLKLIGKPQWGNSERLLDNIEAARQMGCIITCDQYPYEATSTGLSALVPGWAQDGGNSKMLQRLITKDSRLLKDIAAEMERRGGPSCVGISSTHGHIPELDGKNIEEISKIYNLSPEETVIEVLIGCSGETSAIYYSLSLDDVLNIMKEMDISIGSDGYNFSYDLDYNPHPRSFGTFPRFLQIIRENNLMPLEDAVYKITGLPAKIIRLTDRGVLKVGNVADITVFDFNEVKDTSTFVHSPVKPLGIHHVFVAGAPALLDGVQTMNRKGKILLKNN